MSTGPLDDDAAPSDEHLLALARAREEAAFSELMKRHMTAVVRVARRVLGDETEAADVAQDVFLAAFLKLPDWPEGVSFHNWVLWTALSKAVKRARQRTSSARIAKASARLKRVEEPPGDHKDAERAQEVRRAVRRLSERQQAVVSLHFLEGLSVSETARLLKTTANNVRVTLFKALQQLRSMIRR